MVVWEKVQMFLIYGLVFVYNLYYYLFMMYDCEFEENLVGFCCVVEMVELYVVGCLCELRRQGEGLLYLGRCGIVFLWEGKDVVD